MYARAGIDYLLITPMDIIIRTPAVSLMLPTLIHDDDTIMLFNFTFKALLVSILKDTLISDAAFIYTHAMPPNKIP